MHYEVLLATKEDALDESIEQEVFNLAREILLRLYA